MRYIDWVCFQVTDTPRRTDNDNTCGEPVHPKATMRAAPGRSWAVAVCVCVKCIIYHCITVPIPAPDRAERAARAGRRAGMGA